MGLYIDENGIWRDKETGKISEFGQTKTEELLNNLENAEQRQVPDLTQTIKKPEVLILERGKTHGDFTVHAQVTQMLKNVIENQVPKPLTFVQKEALDMICHKIGRIVAGDPDFKDHWADIAGYAQLVAERCSK